jgi:hypothetical protein
MPLKSRGTSTHVSDIAIVSSLDRAMREKLAEETGLPFPQDLPVRVGDEVEFSAHRSDIIRRGTLTAFLPQNKASVLLPPPKFSGSVFRPFIWQLILDVGTPGEKRPVAVGDNVRFFLAQPHEEVRGRVYAFTREHAVVLEHPREYARIGRPTAFEMRYVGGRVGAPPRWRRTWEPLLGNIRRVYRDGVEVACLPWAPYEIEEEDPRIEQMLDQLNAMEAS